jgi:hypothetical protein
MTIGVRRTGPQRLSPAVEARLFLPVAHSRRVACAVCGALGIPGGLWQRPHLRGHSPCLDCGKQLTVKLDHHPRVHARCPGRCS